MKNLFYWLTDKLFDEKVNNVVCWAAIALAGLFIAFQAVRGIGYILISGL